MSIDGYVPVGGAPDTLLLFFSGLIRGYMYYRQYASYCMEKLLLILMSISYTHYSVHQACIIRLRQPSFPEYHLQ